MLRVGCRVMSILIVMGTAAASAQGTNFNVRPAPMREPTANERLQNFRPPPPAPASPGVMDRVQGATTYRSPGGTTVSPNIGGRDPAVYNNPRDNAFTGGVKIQTR